MSPTVCDRMRRGDVPRRMCKALRALAAATLLFAASARAGEKEKDAAAELEIGAAVDWAVPGGNGSVALGPSVGIEVTPIPNWLEIEAEVSPMFSNGRTEWGTELVFKKPYELSDKVEMMLGFGPEWLYRTARGEAGSSIGGVVLADFQLWPTPDRKIGWFIEPALGYDFGREHEQSLGVTVGVLIPIR
jgi:hypothetical protein